MEVVTPHIIEASRRAGAKMADRTTPFIFDCWYVAGFAEEFGRNLVARMILGRPLVLFRTACGEPIALSDRCVHRSYPLSASHLDGDTIVCGYHGLRYNSAGECVEVPATPGICPRGIAVRSYPVRQQGPLVWIWMGDGSPEQELPAEHWIGDADWPSSQQYYHLPASYVVLHENLLDLTHLSFLHATSFGTPDFAAAPYEMSLDDDNGHFILKRSVSPTRLPPVWGEPLGLMGQDAARVTTSEFVGPSAHIVTGHFYALGGDPERVPDTRIKTAHLPTPETATSTHYFIHHARNFAVDRPGVTEFMQSQLQVAFNEDVVGLSKIESLIAQIPVEDLYEISLSSDRPGVAMRRWLLKRAGRGASPIGPVA